MSEPIRPVDEEYGRQAREVTNELYRALERARQVLGDWESDIQASSTGREIAREALQSIRVPRESGFSLKRLHDNLIRDN